MVKFYNKWRSVEKSQPSTYLSVNVDNGTKKPPSTGLTIHMKHAQNLEEAYASNCRCGKHLAIATNCDHDRWCNYHQNIYRKRELVSSDFTLILFNEFNVPIRQMGFLANLKRPHAPMYLLRQPAAHKRTKYSMPKNTTRTISM